MTDNMPVLQTSDFADFTANLQTNLGVVLPIALGIAGGLWALRTAINFFRGIAN